MILDKPSRSKQEIVKARSMPTNKIRIDVQQLTAESYLNVCCRAYLCVYFCILHIYFSTNWGGETQRIYCSFVLNSVKDEKAQDMKKQTNNEAIDIRDDNKLYTFSMRCVNASLKTKYFQMIAGNT